MGMDDTSKKTPHFCIDFSLRQQPAFNAFNAMLPSVWVAFSQFIRVTQQLKQGCTFESFQELRWGCPKVAIALALHPMKFA